jgi:hypothetical protein
LLSNRLKPCNRRNSFAPNTPVTTATGLTAIAALTIGTPVLAYNEATGDTGYYAVTQTHKNQDQDITYLTISGEAIETTSNHPFYLEKQVDNSQRPIIKGHETLSNRWVGAGDLKPGDTIRKANGSSGVVQFVKTVKERSIKYNLTVDTAHTYFVGIGQWLVHNTPSGGKPCLIGDDYHPGNVQNRKDQWSKDYQDAAKSTMLGVDGPTIRSQTVWQDGPTARIDIENPNPGQRPGQIHYQDANNSKFYYDPTSGSFYTVMSGARDYTGIPRAVTRMLQNEGFMRALQKGLRMLEGK